MKATQTSSPPWWTQFSPPKDAAHHRRYLWTKRGLDILLVAVTAPLWLPPLALCALCMKVASPQASVFFTQARTGQGGQRFRMYKFRTMVVNAEALKWELMHLNELQWPDFKITDDPRITRIGRFLRRTSLDELPQLLNVLQGDMSLVGPRPTSFSAETYAVWQTERLDVKPGLTGLWQLYGRSTTEFDERLRLDIAYIEHRCLGLDLQILLRTVFSVLQQRGAH